MKKFMKMGICVCILMQMFMTGIFAKEAEAANVIPYTLGTTVTLIGEENYEYAFELTQRTKLKVHMETYANTSASAYCSFYFEGQDYTVKDYMVYETREKLSAGQTKDLELTFQPGKYHFQVEPSREYANVQSCSFSITALQTIAAPVNTCTVGEDGIYTTVSNVIGKTFSAFNYQYKGNIQYQLSLAYKTQIQIDVTRGTNEYQTYTDSGDYRDSFIVKKASVTGSQYMFTDVSGAERKEWKVDAGATGSAVVTLPAGDYWIIQDRDAYYTDFSVRISVGPVVANKITLDKTTATIEPDETMWLHDTTYPENGTANVIFKSDNPKIAKVDSTVGEVIGISEGTTKIRACLPNGAQAVCTVKVKEETSLAKVESQVGNTCYHDKISLTVWNDTDELFIGADYIGEYTYYQLYRSNKKNGKYKLVKTAKVGARFGFEQFTDTKVKSNTRYYYKARVKTPGKSNYGPMSKPVAYWTAPSPKVKKISDGKVVKWKKNKQATGYIVEEKWFTDAGYNIFFQELFDAHTKSSMTKKRQYKKKHYNKRSTVSLRTYAKHGKYYYVSGEKVTAKKSTFVFQISERHVLD